MIPKNRAEKNGEKACESVLQIGHILDHNRVRGEFYGENSEMSL